jgi:FixJ family two-component response regulator
MLDSSSLTGPASDSGTSKPALLLVEDDDDVRRGLQLMLGSYGYDVISHSSAVGLAQNPRAMRAACLIADLVMPRAGACELLAEMRNAGWRGKAILISGYPEADWRDRAREVGFDAWLTKPIANSILVRTVEHLLNEPGVAGT